MELLREIYRELHDTKGRYTYLSFFVGHLPGVLGNTLRGWLASKYMKSCGVNFLAHADVTLQGINKLIVEDNVQIGKGSYLQATGGITLRDDVMLGPCVKIWSVNHTFDCIDIPIYEQGYTHSPVEIGKGVWLGADVFVMPGVVLPEGCIVSAGSVVNKKKYKPYSILSGNPCRMVGTRLEVK